MKQTTAWAAAPSAALVLLIVAGAAAAEPVGKEGARVARWATGLQGPQGLALDGQGNVYVAENGAGRVTRFRRDGTEPTSIAEGLKSPSWALWMDGALYVSERAGNSVARIDSSGAVTRLKGEVVDPLGLAADPRRPGALLALSHRESRVFRFIPDPSGELRREAEPAVAPAEGSKYGWRDLVVAPEGTIYVTDELGRRILRRKPGGVLEEWVSGLAGPSGLARGPGGELYVTEEGNGRLSRITADGRRTVLAEGLGMARAALFLDARTLLVSDRQGGSIWQVALPE